MKRTLSLNLNFKAWNVRENKWVSSSVGCHNQLMLKNQNVKGIKNMENYAHDKKSPLPPPRKMFIVYSCDLSKLSLNCVASYHFFKQVFCMNYWTSSKEGHFYLGDLALGMTKFNKMTKIFIRFIRIGIFLENYFSFIRSQLIVEYFCTFNGLWLSVCSESLDDPPRLTEALTSTTLDVLVSLLNFAIQMKRPSLQPC